MFARTRLHAPEAYDQASVLHKTWEDSSLDIIHLVRIVGFVKEERPNAELVLFLSEKDTAIIPNDPSFSDYFDVVTRKEILDYDYLGMLCGINVYKRPTTGQSELRERLPVELADFKNLVNLI